MHVTLSFSGGGSAVNVPLRWKTLPYNDVYAVREYMRAHGRDVSAIIVEPILGAGGNIPGTAEFLRSLREEATQSGSILIFDEVKTSRCGPAGMQGLHGIKPDLSTLGKYLGGGMPLAAFGGRADLMDRYDPRRPDSLRHAGTFNNNVMSMSAGLAGLTGVFTPTRAASFHGETEIFKDELARRLRKKGMPLHLTGHGSMFSMHKGENAPQCAADVTEDTLRMRRLMHLECIGRGILLTGRGDIYLNLAMQREDLESLMLGLEEAAESALQSL